MKTELMGGLASSLNRWPGNQGTARLTAQKVEQRREKYGCNSGRDDSREQTGAYSDSPAVGPGGEWWLYAACAVAAIAASAADFPRVGFAAVMVAAGVACWRMARSER